MGLFNLLWSYIDSGGYKMATNNSLKRIEVKYVRDGVKANYKKATACEICNSEADLELHHYSTLNRIWEKFKKEQGLPKEINDESVILVQREIFYKQYWTEAVVDAVTLCNPHHKLLHKIYGIEPLVTTAPKQKNWVAKQHDKWLAKQCPSETDLPTPGTD